MAALATAADMIQRFDVRMLGDLVSDNGTRVGADDLASHPNLSLAIDDAWGEVIASLMRSQRYRQEDFDALADESLAYLVRINCQLALGNLWERRGWSEQDAQAMGHVSAANRARKELEDLSSGKKVLNLNAPKEAGLPTIHQPSVSSVARANLVVDEARRGFYLRRRYATT